MLCHRFFVRPRTKVTPHVLPRDIRRPTKETARMGNKRLFGASALWITPSSAALLPWAGHAPQDGGVGGLTDGHGKASGKAVEGKLGGMPRQAPAAGLFA